MIEFYTRRKAFKLIRQFAEALGAVHKAGFIHRDLSRNFIATPDCTGLKLFDFGLSLPMNFFHQPKPYRTPFYMARKLSVDVKQIIGLTSLRWGSLFTNY